MLFRMGLITGFYGNCIEVRKLASLCTVHTVGKMQSLANDSDRSTGIDRFQ